MAKTQLLLCFSVLFAVVALLDVASATLKIKPSLGQIEVPKTVEEVEPYTVKVVMVFVSDLEKQCPQTSKFKAFFERLRAYARFVCPLKKFDQSYERDMKAKAGSLFQTISSFAVGKIKEKIQEEKMEAINNFKMMKTIAGKIIGGRKENEDSMTLTTEQQKEIKEGILKWETVITKITETMIESTSSSSTSEVSTSTKGTSSKDSSSSEVSMGAKGTSSKSFGFKDTTGSASNMGSPSGSPKNKPSGSKGGFESGKETSFKDTTVGSKISPSGSPKAAKGGSSTTSSKDSNSKAKGESSTTFADTTGKSSVGSPKSSPSKETSSKGSNTRGSKTGETSTKDTSATAGKSMSLDSTSSSSTATQKTTTTVTEVEAQTSKEIMTFIMNLEKKCPQKEEYKSFFEKLKTTMTGSASGSPRKRGGLLYGIKNAAGRLGEAMLFMRARIGAKSVEVKKSMENYQAEVMKAVEELDAIHQKIMAENKSKQGGSVQITSQQQMELKQTITKWEKVTTQFVETAVQSESSSSSSSTSTSSSVDKKMQAN